MTDLPLTTEGVESPLEPNQKWKITRECLLEGVLYLSVFLLTALLFFILKPFIDVYHVGAIARGLIALTLGGCGVFIAYMGMTKRLKARHVGDWVCNPCGLYAVYARGYASERYVFEKSQWARGVRLDDF